MPILLMLIAMLVPSPGLGAAAGEAAGAATPAGGAEPGRARLFVTVDEAAALIAAGATVLDARAKGYFLGHVPGAQPVSWRDSVDGWGRTGRLHPDPAKLARDLSALGVDGGRAVLVYGDAQAGYGEEGRIAWLLAYLGHPRAHILDGGIAAWRRASRPLARGFSARPRPAGPWSASVQPWLRADKARVLAATTDTARPLIIDVRSLEEWRGATPYLEARGGHIPGAVHLDWLRLVDESGRLRSPPDLLHALASVGVFEPSREPREIIVYCTGGVRSAFAWAVLRALGYPAVRNYDGSFWEWAADRSLPVETAPGPR